MSRKVRILTINITQNITCYVILYNIEIKPGGTVETIEITQGSKFLFIGIKIVGF
jgi:hypothetical protein